MTAVTTRRASLKAAAAAITTLILPKAASAAAVPFDRWIDAFRAKAVAHGIADETYARVMNGIKPDPTGLEAIRNQAEFNQKLWQYLNRAVSDWKVSAGKDKAKQYAPLLSRIETDFGVEPAFMLGVWGIESAFSDPMVAKNHMRPVIPSLATLAWAEPSISRKSSIGSPRSASIPAAPTAASASPRRSRCAPISAKPASIRRTAMQAWDFSPGCAKAHDPVG